jgi:predicted dehydrogenase
VSVSGALYVAPDVEAIRPEGRVAIVGAGAFGRFCIDAYQRHGDVAVVAVADSEAGGLAQVDAPGAELTGDWRRIMNRLDVEAVHVATPPWLRLEVVEAALASGKSVMCEKPLALTLDEADSMIDAASRAGLALGADYVMRHHPAYHLLYALSASGMLGEVRSISLQNFAQRMPPDHWFWDRQLSGGILVEHGVHFFDAFGRIAGPARHVRGDSLRREAVHVIVDYAGGAIGRYYHEFAFLRAVERTLGIVFFERGYVEIDGWIPERLTGSVLAPAPAVRAIATDIGCPFEVREDDATHVNADFGDRSVAYGACIVAGMRDVVHRHRNPAYRMEVAPDDARRSLALALASQRAIDTGEVEVPQEISASVANSRE